MQKDYLEIKGGNPLYGTVKIHSAKNAVLPMLAGAILTEEEVTLLDCPRIVDVDNMTEILSEVGLSVVREGRSITVGGKVERGVVGEKLSRAMRSSVFLLGALLSETGRVRLYTPGGCNIGARPIDIHLDGLSRLGAKIEYGKDFVECSANRLKGAEIVFKYPSVGATENLLLASVKAEGESTLIGCAREPEILSLCEMLRGMGAEIYGEGTSVVKVKGVDKLYGTTVKPVSDRIVAGTIISAVAVTGGRVIIENAETGYLGSFLKEILSEHIRITDSSCGITVESDGVVLPSNIITGPYPTFPTDLQPVVTAVKCFANGVSTVTETVFENRFAHVGELANMGVNIDIDGFVAIVRGRGKLHSSVLHAYDLRGGAGLVVASLGAKGVGRVYGLRHIDRGYEKIEELFASLGGVIRRKTEFEE